MKDKKIHLTVQTLSGKYQHPFDADQTLQSIMEATWEHLHITPSPGEVWELRLGDTLLNSAQTIEAAGLQDKAVLMLTPKEGEGAAMDPAVSRMKFEREALELSPAANDLVLYEGWEYQEIAFPLVKVVFTHPTSKRAVGFRFRFDNWDGEPPSLALYDPTTGEDLPWDRWPQGGWAAHGNHPATGKPFLCLPGISEYHAHSSHLDDKWANYHAKGSFSVGFILHRVWQKFKVTNG